jgi:hypothetical protein
MFKIAQKSLDKREKILKQLEDEKDTIGIIEYEKLKRQYEKANNSYNNNILFLRFLAVMGLYLMIPRSLYPKVLSIKNLSLGSLFIIYNIYQIKPSYQLQKKNQEINEEYAKIRIKKR